MSAASWGSFTSRGTAPLAAKSSTQRRPEPASCRPFSTQSRPQPKRRSAARGLPPQSAWATSAWNRRRRCPLRRWAAERIRSSYCWLGWSIMGIPRQDRAIPYTRIRPETTPYRVVLRLPVALLRDVPTHVQRRQAYVLRDPALPARHGTRSPGPVGRAQQPAGGGTSDAPLAESRPALARLGGAALCLGQRR